MKLYKVAGKESAEKSDDWIEEGVASVLDFSDGAKMRVRRAR